MKRKTTETFKQEVYDLVGDEYSVLGEYINCHTKILVRHNTCGHEYYVTPDHFLRGRRCPHCFGNNKKTTKGHAQEVNNLTNGKYAFTGEYINSRTKAEYTHLECGNTFMTRPDNFLQGTRCPYCFGTPKKTTNSYAKEVHDKTNGKYAFTGNYIDNNTKAEHTHLECGYKWLITPINFLKGCRCPRCARIRKISKGEQTIKNYLDKHNIKYIAQAIFPDCKYKQSLRFDFQIFLEDGTFILIEYNGAQHYRSSGYITEDVLFKIQKRDKIKKEYCKNKGIPLEIIRYDEDIEERLQGILEIYNLN